MDKKRGFILLAALCLAAIAVAPLHAATPIRNAKSGIVLFRKSGFDSLDKPIVFSRIEQDQAYYDIVTSAGYLVHIETDRVVKVVYFLDPTTFPTKFEPEDLAVLKAKADELRALKTLSPAAVQLATSQIEYLQNVYDTETARYKQTAEIAALKFNSEQEKTAFDKKCDLLRLDFLANPGDLAHSEEVIKQMEPLAPRSELLTGFLSKWNEEKTRALQLAAESRDLWTAAQKTHPELFKPAADIKSIPPIPDDLKDKIADLQDQLDQFRSIATNPQSLLYCKNEVPAIFLLNELPKLTEKIKTLKYQDAALLAQKALQQVQQDQFVAPYIPIYDTFKNDAALVDDLRTRYQQQLTRAQNAENTLTAREALAEYQKAYDLIPDDATAAKIADLKFRIKNQ